MPKGPVTPKHIIEAVEELWEEESKDNRKVKAVEIWKMTGHLNPRPQIRKVQLIIQEVRGRGKPIPPDAEMVPWDFENGWPDDAEGVECLFGLIQVAKLLPVFDHSIEPLDVRTAKWALRLRKFFHHSDERTSPFNHLWWSRVYARRERVKERLVRDQMRTGDLDGLFMMRALDSQENWEAYQAAVEGGLVPPLDASKDLEDRIALDPEFWGQLLTKLQQGDNDVEDQK